jgi:hypothetical protein
MSSKGIFCGSDSPYVDVMKISYTHHLQSCFAHIIKIDGMRNIIQ